MNMLSRTASNARKHAVLASSVTATSIATLLISHRKEECDDIPKKDITVERTTPDVGKLGLLGLIDVDTIISTNGFSQIILDSNNKYCSCESLLPNYHRRNTIQWLGRTSSKERLESRYKVDWDNPLGEGGFGSVYLCTDRDDGEKRALKVISKQYTDQDSFKREMDALLHVRDSGSHPNICRLKENFEQRGNYYLVLDLISGGEMFDHLCKNGAYSESDAARLVKETTSALAFLHGVGLVHADLKPENLMLSTPNKTDSVIKLVDFGCSEFFKGDVDKKQTRDISSNTPAYSPPESFSKWKGPLQPSFDMFSLGVILYIMLCGVHPFDIDGRSTDEEIQYKIKNEAPPLRNSHITAHLSDSAIQLLENLLDKKPRRRLTAQNLLEHPWVTGETARTSKIQDSDKKLSGFRKFKSRLEIRVFSDWIASGATGNARKSGLMEMAFKSLDTNEKGFVTAKDLTRSLARKDDKATSDSEDSDDAPLSLSGFSDLLSDNMTNKYFPEGYKIYKEGSKGDAVYFINSGTVEVSTRAGFKTTLSTGQLFGEGALLEGAKGRRNATIKCLTPVHLIRISKDYFAKYMEGGGSDLNLILQEQDRSRDRDRACKILRNQKNLLERNVSKGEVLFSFGEVGNSLFILDEGEIKITGETGKHVLDIKIGEICGEHALVMKEPRNTTATCSTDKCKVYEMAAKDFYKLYNSSQSMKQSFREVCLRRDFQKAIVKKFGADFGTSAEELRKAFDAADLDKNGYIDLDEVKGLLKLIYPHLSGDDPIFTEVLQHLDIDGTKTIKWDKFQRVFLTKRS